MISDAIHAYLAELDTQRIAREQRAREEALDDDWFGAYDAAAHVAYEPAPPKRLARLGAWLRPSR